MREAAAAFVELGARAALVKGGHLAAEPTDVLAEGDRIRELPRTRVDGTVRGTGDLLAVTIATCLARGATLDGSGRTRASPRARSDRRRRAVREHARCAVVPPE